MTDKECIALLKEKMEGENAPGSMLEGTGIKYDYHITESGKPIFSMYIPEIQALFFPIKNEKEYGKITRLLETLKILR